MSSQDDHLRHFATYLNIAAGGVAVAAVATAPLSAATSGKLDALTLAGFVSILSLDSIVLHGASQLVLMWVKP